MRFSINPDMHVNGKAEKYELTVKTHLEYYRGLLMKVFLCIIGHLMSDVHVFLNLCFFSSEFGEMQYTVNLTTMFQRILVVSLTNQLSNYWIMTISCARLDSVSWEIF